MKVSVLLLPLAAAISSAFVVPDEQTQQVISQEIKGDKPSGLREKPSSALIIAPQPCHKKAGKDGVKKHRKGVYVDKVNMEGFHGREWIKSPQYQALDVSEYEVLSEYRHHKPTHGDRESFHPHPPKHGGHDEPNHGDREHPPKHGGGPDEPDHGHHPHPPPHHPPPHHHKPNETIWQLISTSKYTTKLAKIIGEYDDLVEILNGTAHNYTLFAPTDRAFEKLHRHHGNHSDHKPSKELIKKVLTYHLSPEFYPAGKVLTVHTIPSALIEEQLLGGPQRLRVGLGLRGLAVNFYSRIVAVDIFATNGVIHGVDSILLPPPPAYKIIELLPSTFSTFSLAVSVTNLTDAIPKEHTGLTLFAPSNNAFQRLGPRLNAFLFSPYGRKYLAALLKYHIVYNQTLYSDAYYHGKFDDDTQDVESASGIPKGHYHVDLPTLLAGKHLSIDIGRFGGLIDITINGVVKVGVQDGIARDGVIQVVRSVLVPPKTPGSNAEEIEGEMTVEDFKGRFTGLIEEDDVDSEMYLEEDFITLW